MASKGKRVLMGCGIGCGLLLLMGVGSCIGFTAWLNRPGELIEPTRLMAAGTTGYMEWTLDGDDPGTAAFVQAMVDRAQGSPSQPTGWAALLQRFVPQGRSGDPSDLQALLPVVLVWTLEAGEAPGAGDLHLLGISAERMGNRLTFMDWILRKMLRSAPGVEIVEYEDEQVFVTDNGTRSSCFFVRDETVFFTSDFESARRAVDRLRTPAPPVASATGDAFAALPETAIRGAVVNEHGSLRELWDVLAAVPEDAPRDVLDWERVRMATFTGGLSGPNAFEGRLELHGVDPEWAEANAEAFVQTLRADYRRSHLPFETEVSVDGDRILVDLQIPDVEALMDEF